MTARLTLLGDDAARAWAHRRVVVLRGMVDPRTCAAWEQATRALPTRSTYYPSAPSSTWLQTTFDADDTPGPCDGLGRDPQFLAALERVTGLRGLSPARSMVWLNRYRPGDEVPEHRDAVGDCQFMLCLQGPPDADGGGQAVVAGEEIRLAAGDALLWKATLVPHRMTRIASGNVHPSGFTRVVCVFRYAGTAEPTPEV